MSELDDPANVIDGHLAMRGSAYTGPGWRALHCSAKTELGSSLSAEGIVAHVRQALGSLVRSLPASVQQEAEETDAVSDAMWRVRSEIGGQRARPRLCEAEPRGEDMLTLKSRFAGMVISEIDKERGELAVL
jgi:hypothetical protein